MGGIGNVGVVIGTLVAEGLWFSGLWRMLEDFLASFIPSLPFPLADIIPAWAGHLGPRRRTWG